METDREPGDSTAYWGRGRAGLAPPQGRGRRPRRAAGRGGGGGP